MAEDMFKHCLETNTTDKIIGNNSAEDLANVLVASGLLDQCPVCGAFIGCNIDCLCCLAYDNLKKSLETVG